MLAESIQTSLKFRLVFLYESHHMLRYIYIFLGSISILVGLIGIVVPGLPTTVFLLIAAALYAKGSQRFYNALVQSKFLGAYIRNFRKGMSLQEKIRAMSMMWTMILISVIFFIDQMAFRALVVALGVVGTIAMSLVKVRRDD